MTTYGLAVDVYLFKYAARYKYKNLFDFIRFLLWGLLLYWNINILGYIFLRARKAWKFLRYQVLFKLQESTQP